MAAARSSGGTVFWTLVASFPAAYALYKGEDAIWGHPAPVTTGPQWQAQTRLMNLSKEMEGDPERPVLLNPFRTGVPATVRTKDDLPSLEEE